jgi:type II secretory pathway pseudopilin PulG
MKRVIKSILGVTLLEIMLVLAIASMIILMSVRYYKSATASQQATALLEQIQVITAAGDSLALGSTGYSAVTTANLQNALGGSTQLNTPWGAITVSASTATTYTIAFPATLPTDVCTSVETQLSASPKYTAVTCTGYTYTSTD